MTEQRTLSVYFVAQAAVGVFFWFLVTGPDEGRRIFDLMPGHPNVTDAFFSADLLAIATSLACAWALDRDASWALPIVAFTAGCMVYPTIYLIAWAPSSAGGARCLLIMVPPSVITTWITVRLWHQDRRRH